VVPKPVCVGLGVLLVFVDVEELLDEPLVDAGTKAATFGPGNWYGESGL